MKRFIPLSLFILIYYSCQQKPKNTEISSSTQVRPNIVWIVNEDMSPEHLEVYGGTGGKTPNLNALAAEGLRYTNAFSTAGVCAPSRAALITGAYQTSIGAHHMRTTGLSKGNEDAYPPGHKSYSTVIPADMKTYPELLRMAGYYTSNNSKEDYQFYGPVTMWDESSREAHWRNREDPNQPFFSIFNLTISHESQVWARENEPLLVDPDSVLVPPVYPDDSITRRTLARFITNVMRMDQQAGEIIDQLKEDGLYENTIIFFYSDHGDGMPYYKRELYDRGLKVPLIIKAPSLKPGTVTNELVSFVDFGPTVLSLAGVDIPESMQGQAFLGSQKAIKRKYVYAARDRMDSEYDRVRAVSDGRYKYVRNYMSDKPNYQNIRYRLNNPLMLHLLDLHERELLDENQERWFDESKPLEELYDTKNDPYEFKNLAGQVDYIGKLEELREAHLKWIKDFGDLGEMNEQAMVSMWWNGEDEAPITAEPTIKFYNGTLTILCETEGASIGYRSSEDDGWSIYQEPIPWEEGESIIINAHRIGYEPNEITIEVN